MAFLLQVKVALYAKGQEVLSLTFNGTGSTKYNWFDQTRLEVHPWTDIDPSTTYAEFNQYGANANS